MNEDAVVADEPVAKLHQTLVVGTALLGIVALAVVALTVLVALQVRGNRATRAESAARQACQRWTAFATATGSSPLPDTPAHQVALHAASQASSPRPPERPGSMGRTGSGCSRTRATW